MAVSLLITSAPFCTFTCHPRPVAIAPFIAPNQTGAACSDWPVYGWISLSRRSVYVEEILRRCCCTTLQRPHTRYLIHACLQRLLQGQARKPSSRRSSRKEGSFLRSWYIIIYSAAALPGTSCSRVPLPAVYPNSCKPSKSNAHPTAALDSSRASNSWRATTPRRPETADRDLSVDLAAVILLEQKSNPPTASVISFWGLQCGSPPEM
jgi:hypothetical protein